MLPVCIRNLKVAQSYRQISTSLQLRPWVWEIPDAALHGPRLHLLSIVHSTSPHYSIAIVPEVPRATAC